MAIRKKPKRAARRGRKFVILRVGREVYVAPLSALGPPVREDKEDLDRRIAVFLKKKKGKCCHGTSLCGVFVARTFGLTFGNGHISN